MDKIILIWHGLACGVGDIEADNVYRVMAADCNNDTIAIYHGIMWTIN